MPLDFPSSPTNGQTYPGPGGITWVYDGTKWVIQGASGTYLPLTGGVLASPGNLTVRGGILTGAAGAVPAAGSMLLNANTVAPPAGLTPNLYVAGADGAAVSVAVDSFGTVSFPSYRGRKARGTAAAPAAVQLNDTLVGLEASAYGAAYTSVAGAYFVALETFSASAQGAAFDVWTNPTGTTGGVRSLRLAGATATFAGNALIPGGVGVGQAATAPVNGFLTLNANTVAPPAGVSPNLYTIGANGADTQVWADSFGGVPQFNGRKARGTATAPTAVQNADALMYVVAQGASGAGTYGAFGSPAILMLANENWSGSAQGSTMQFRTTPNGSTSPVNSLVLQGNSATFSGNMAVGGTAIPASTRNSMIVGNNLDLIATQGFNATGNIYYDGSTWRLATAAAGGLFGGGSGGFNFFYAPSGAAGAVAALQQLATINTDGTFQITGGTAYKPGGGSWTAPSARELKREIKPYNAGLQAILALKPVSYHYDKSTGFAPDETHIGLVHDECSHMPEMHTTAVIGGTPDKPGREVDALDCSAITFALVNAIRELKAEIDTLKKARK